jgi:hypothetical protein
MLLGNSVSPAATYQVLEVGQAHLGVQKQNIAQRRERWHVKEARVPCERFAAVAVARARSEEVVLAAL